MIGRGARLGVDIGGTFTDLVLVAADGQMLARKVPSTPERPEQAVIEGIRMVLGDARLEPSDLAEIVHGTTVGSNTLLQKAGARCGLITTRGFRDVLEIGRVRTPGMFDLTWDKPEPLIPRRFRLEVDERMSARGELLKGVDPEQVIEAGGFFRAHGIESVAICFLNSYANPANELAAAAAFAAACPEIALTASVAVLPESGEYERTSTAAVNAYVLPVLRGYLERLQTALREIGVAAPLLVGNSNGGLSTASVACRKPVFFISSGRSSGATGAAKLGAAIGQKNLIVFDMGGTTASAALMHDGVLSRANEYEFRAGMSVPSRFIKAGGYMMRVPTIDVAEVGSGAGSIAAVDDGGLLCVGPVSAGALPGPVCYGMGGERPTVTDANVALGFLPPVLAGGSVALDVGAARRAIERDLAEPFRISVERAATGVREVANANMARAIRAVTVERGVDPRDFTLLAFGGSGPVHACDLARTLGIGTVLFPPSPGVFTAMGMLAGHVEHHVLRPCPGLLEGLDAQAFRGVAAEMRVEAVRALEDEGYDPDRLVCAFAIDLRFHGQDSAVAVPFDDAAPLDPAALRRTFLDAYQSLYHYVSKDRIETVAVRLRAEIIGSVTLDFRALRASAPQMRVAPRKRNVYFGGTSWLETSVLDRADFTGSQSGPLILESPDTTIVIPPGAIASLDHGGNLVATLH